MDNVKVSIIIPVYNAAQFIEECVGSIIRQSFRDFELILVNDGSKDNSLEMCQQLACKDDRIIVLDKENGGSSSAKNFGMAKAQGEYIAFCDSDDTLDETYIENLYKGVLLHNADVCVGNVAFTRVDNSEVVSRRTVEMTKGFFSLKEYMKYYPKYMPNAVMGAPWNKLYRRDIITENSLSFNTNVKNNEDTHFNFQFFAKCKNVYVSDSPFYNYMDRIGISSASKGFIPNIFDIYVMTYNKAINFLKETDTYDENISFQNQYFIGLIIGAINGIINGNNKLSFAEKIKQIKNICNNEDVRNAVKTVKFDNKKKKIVSLLIKSRQPLLVYILFLLNK
jgi:glycosyltransferase involved in cell wall biosynthesis